MGGSVTQNAFYFILFFFTLTFGPALACMIKQPHQRQHRGRLKSLLFHSIPSLCWAMIFMVWGSESGHGSNFDPQSDKNPQNPEHPEHPVAACGTTGGSKAKRGSGNVLLPFCLFSSSSSSSSWLLTSGAGNRSHGGRSDVTVLSNGQIEKRFRFAPPPHTHLSHTPSAPVSV